VRAAVPEPHVDRFDVRDRFPHCAKSGYANPRGITLMIAVGTESRSIVRPTAVVSPPNFRCHKSHDRTVTRFVPARSSLAANVRPRYAAVPISGKKPGVTNPVTTRSAPPPRLRSVSLPRTNATPATGPPAALS